ncbi:MAG: M3 family metallopeptidase [Pseudomonadota bacterium]
MTKSNAETANPAIFEWSGAMGLPDFSAVSSSDYAAAFDVALEEDRRDINAIADNPAPATFENTIETLETSGEKLGRVSALFWNLSGAHSDDTLRALEREIAPRLSKHGSETAANAALFARIDALWQNRDQANYTLEQERVLERHWKSMMRSGAALEKSAQNQLAQINAQLASLGAQFSQNILGDEADWHMHLTEEADLDGLPAFLVQAMKAAATERGLTDGACVTLSRSIIEPFLAYSARKDLRAKAFAAWTGRGSHEGDRDNRPLVRQIVQLRQKKAALLGYASFAHLKLENQMAKTPDAVRTLLETVWDKARTKALEEQAQLQEQIAADGDNTPVTAADWRYLTEKVRQARYDFNEAEIKPYLALDNIINAAFDVANRLFGLTFKEQSHAQAYHPDARVFEVSAADGTHKALFIADYFARSSKRSGAWMSGFQSQQKLPTPLHPDGQIPIIVNVMNFAKAPEGEPALLSLDDARTLFHEFGHALHGMVSDVTYPSVSGTSVARDFVELPSQLYEHWLTVPDILKKHARHHESGAVLPDALLAKIKAAEHFNAGFEAVEFTASALVDLAFHEPGAVDPDDETFDPMAFQEQVLNDLAMPSAITMRHATPHFAHVFSGDGYSAGYYSYMWSEVLDADAFKAFEDAGDPFDPVLAEKLKTHVYAAGGSVDPEDAYKAFRGRMPTPDAMLQKRGLIDPADKAA